MKPPTGKRARNLAKFQAELRRKKAVVEAVWSRDQMPYCRVCHHLVMRRATDPNYAGYIHWKNPAHVEVDGAYLVCGKHFKPQIVYA